MREGMKEEDQVAEGCGGWGAQEGQVMSSNVASSRGAGAHGFKMVAPKTPSPPYPRGLHGEASRDAESKPDL